MINATPKQIYNELSEVYDDCYKEAIHRIEDEFVYDFLEKNGFLKGNVLDTGSGTGSMLSHVKISPENFTGLDISENMIDLSSAKYPEYIFKRGTMNKMPFKSQSFDNVISLFGSFSYSHNLQKTVAEIERVLKPGGKFLVMAYGVKYPHRKSYILNQFDISSPATFLKANELKDLFGRFDNVRIFGMTWLSEFISKYFPYSLAKLYHKFEMKYLSPLLINQFYFLIITGQKNAQTLLH